MTINEKLLALRNEMKKRNIDAYIIPSSDPHQSEYVAPLWKAREWISGFTGSAGTVVVTLEKACLWVDSRYYTQAENEIKGTEFELFKWGIDGVLYYPQWLAKECKEKTVIGFDGALLSPAQVKTLKLALKEKEMQFKYEEDIIELIWKDRPTVPTNKVKELSIENTGKSRKDKIEAIRTEMNKKDVHATFISSLDDIAWILNIRGTDISYNPIVISYLYITKECCIFFAEKSKFNNAIIKNIENDNIEFAEYNAVFSKLNEIKDRVIFIDNNKTSQKIYDILNANNKLIEGRNFSTDMKAKKNAVELEGFRKAHIEDGVAMVKWLTWLNKSIGKMEMDEVSIADKLEKFRAMGETFQGLSFNPIVGYRGNGANPHYSAKPGTCAKIENERVLLVDSGGQYLGGTTDITRTMVFGEPTSEEKKHNTLVLKGMIQLTMAHFPKNTTGAQLDTFARMDMWKQGLNFGHGTGHGVGHFLCVHEGPQGISPRSNKVTLDLGMILSNEPGLYFVNEYGIRIENLIAVIPTKTEGFYTFETLTMVPIDLKLIDVEIMTSEEIEWLNLYHKEVYDKISPSLNDEERTWLRENTKAIQR